MKPVIVAAVVAGVVAGAVGAIVAWSVVRASPGPGPYQRQLTQADRDAHGVRATAAVKAIGEEINALEGSNIDMRTAMNAYLNWIATHPRADAEADVAALRRILKDHVPDCPPADTTTDK